MSRKRVTKRERAGLRAADRAIRSMWARNLCGKAREINERADRQRAGR